MDEKRLRELLKIAVNHIENFEDKESAKVLKSLGFTADELAEINFELNMTDLTQEQAFMLYGCTIHNGECIWELTYAGNEYIFSDFREDEAMPNGYFTKNIPLQEFSHYFYYDESRDVYTGYAWYNPTESYVDDFNSLEECLNWLVSEHDDFDEEFKR